MKRFSLVIVGVVVVMLGLAIGIPFVSSVFVPSDDGAGETDGTDGESAGPANETAVPTTALTATAAPTTGVTDSATAPSTATVTSAGVTTPLSTPTLTATATSTPIPDPTPTSTPTATPTATSTPTATPTPTPVPPMDLNRSVLEGEIAGEINDYRARNGLDRLQAQGNTVETITAMGRNHSRQLRADGEAWNLPSEYDITGLYQSYGLYESCKFLTNGEGGVIKPDDGRVMAVHRLDVDIEDESHLAQRTVEHWNGHRFHGEKLGYENAEQIGVGVAMDHENDVVYVAMSVC